LSLPRRGFFVLKKEKKLFGKNLLMLLEAKITIPIISSKEVSKKTIIPTNNPARKTISLPILVNVSEKVKDIWLPTSPLLVIATKQRKKIKKPMGILGREKNNFNLRKRNPKRIKTKGKRKAKNPNFSLSKLLIMTKESPFFEKESKRSMPLEISPREKIV